MHVFVAVYEEQVPKPLVFHPEQCGRSESEGGRYDVQLSSVPSQWRIEWRSLLLL